jgi:hypothetical protein
MLYASEYFPMVYRITTINKSVSRSGSRFMPRLATSIPLCLLRLPASRASFKITRDLMQGGRQVAGRRGAWEPRVLGRGSAIREGKTGEQAHEPSSLIKSCQNEHKLCQ